MSSLLGEPRILATEPAGPLYAPGSALRAVFCPGLSMVRAADWDRLLGPYDRPLLSWAYLEGLEAAGCVGPGTSWYPAHLLIERVQKPLRVEPAPSESEATRRPWSGDEGELLAAAPAYVKLDSDGEWVHDFDWAQFSESHGLRYYPKLVLAVPFNPVTGCRLLTRDDLPDGERDRLRLALLSAAKRLCNTARFSSVHVLFLRDAELAACDQAGFYLRHQEQYHFLNDGYRGFEDFLARMRGHRRTAIRRERKALVEAGITVTTHRGLATGAEAAQGAAHRQGFTRQELDRIFDLYVGTSQRYTGELPYLNRRFFHLCAERLGDRLELVLARQAPAADGSGDEDGELLGGAWNLRGDRRLYGRYWGEARHVPFLHFEVCLYHSVERCIREGLTGFEPGHGGEHKLLRGFTPVATYSAHYLRDPRLRRPIGAFLRYEAPLVAESIRAARARGPLREPDPTVLVSAARKTGHPESSSDLSTPHGAASPAAAEPTPDGQVSAETTPPTDGAASVSAPESRGKAAAESPVESPGPARSRRPRRLTPV